MIVDSSAIVAVVRQEPDADVYDQAIVAADRARLSAASYLETGIVVDSPRDAVASRHLDSYLRTVGVHVEPLTEAQARIARDAFRDFGKGSGHPAGLNFGDCLAYALAKDLGEPLLFKGDDFVHTDVIPALPRQ